MPKPGLAAESGGLYLGGCSGHPGSDVDPEAEGVDAEAGEDGARDDGGEFPDGWNDGEGDGGSIRAVCGSAERWYEGCCPAPAGGLWLDRSGGLGGCGRIG